MEGLAILGLIWGILCIILFFKVWNACNCIKRLAAKYAPENAQLKLKHNTNKSNLETRESIDNWLKEEQ